MSYRAPMHVRMERHRNCWIAAPSFLTPPPRQNSPTHILNALSAECIQRVLTYLIGDIRDFLSAAEVCRTFQQNAKQCYPSIYADFDLCTDVYGHLPLDQVKRFLSTFGRAIKSILWKQNRKNHSYEREIFGAITEFCGGSLHRLDIYSRDLDFRNVSQLKLLKELTLSACTIRAFDLPPNLQQLIFHSNDIDRFDWMAKTHANLKTLKLYSVDQLTDGMFIEFQSSNPQLEILMFHSPINLTPAVLRGIATRLPNLRDIEFNFPCLNDNKMALQRKFDEDLMHLGDLRSLQRLHCAEYTLHMLNCSLLDSLADNSIPIADLRIDGWNPCIAACAAKLKGIRKLELSTFSCEMVVDLVMKLPDLQKLKMYNCQHVSLNGIKRILDLATNLTALAVTDFNLLLDSDRLINSILDLVRGRTAVEIYLPVGNVRVALERFATGFDSFKICKIL